MPGILSGGSLPRLMAGQAAWIAGAALLLGLAVNALRPDGLALDPAPVRADPHAVSLDEARRLHAADGALFLDARSDYEFAQGRVQGALNLPVNQFDWYLDELRPTLEAVPVLITYCDGEKCPLSTELADLLRAAGFLDVRVLKNGWSLWLAAGLPVERGEPEGSAWK
jgi:rhodanese-related sulfurtransferase